MVPLLLSLAWYSAIQVKIVEYSVCSLVVLKLERLTLYLL